MQNEKVWILSDDNSKSLAHILIANYFSQELQTDIQVFDQMNEMEDLLEFNFYHDDQVLYYIFESSTMSEFTKSKCKEYGIKYFDIQSAVYNYIGSIFSKISKGGNIPQILQKSLENNPVDFALTNDDGSNPKSIIDSDIVIIGVSRTSKTPLSIYMSNLGYKVTNIPLVPEIEIPKELRLIDSNKIVALKMDPQRLVEIRKERVKVLGLPLDSGYSSLERVLYENEYSQTVIEELNCEVIDVSHISIEETSDKIKKIIDLRRT